MHAKHRTLGFLSCALASAIWGCGFYFGKIALTEMSVGAMVLYRFVFGTIGLLPLLFTHRPKFSAADWGVLLVASLFGIPMLFLLEFRGLALTTVSHASLMVGVTPVVLAIAAVHFARERMHTIGWVALGISTLGAALIALSSSSNHEAHGPSLAGDLLIAGSTLIALLWILFNKRLMETHNHLTVTAYGVTAGTLMLVVWVPLTWGMSPVHGISLHVWFALAASGLLCTATTTLLWNWGITQVPASQAGVLLNLEPLIGSLLGVFLLHEHLGPLAWLGGALILTAAFTLTRGAPSKIFADV